MNWVLLFMNLVKLMYIDVKFVLPFHPQFLTCYDCCIVDVVVEIGMSICVE